MKPFVGRERYFFLTGTESVKDTAKSGIPMTVTGKINVCNVEIYWKVIANFRYCQTCSYIAIIAVEGVFHFEAYFASGE